MKRVTALALCLTLTGVLAAQTQSGTASTTGKTAKRKATSSNTEVLNQINQLKQAVDAQQQQIKQLSDQVQSRDQQIQQLQQKLDQDQSNAQTTQSLIQQVDTKASNASTQASQASDSLNKIQSDVADIRNNTTNMALSQQDSRKSLRPWRQPSAVSGLRVTCVFVASRSFSKEPKTVTAAEFA